MRKAWPFCFALLVFFFIPGAKAYAQATPTYTQALSQQERGRAQAAAAHTTASDTTDGPSVEDYTASTAKKAAGHAGDGFIRLTPDQTKILRLNKSAASVIVTNPLHAAIVLENPRLLIIQPRTPGTTSFTVLDNRGNRITERTVIVSTSARPKYVRVRRVCGANDPTCAAASYSYCPDGCYDVMPVHPDAPGSSAAAPPITGTPPADLPQEEPLSPEAAAAEKKDLSGDYYPGNVERQNSPK